MLLENRAGALPLAPSVRRLAVVGPMADDLPVLLANYHGIPSRPVKLLDGDPRRGARPRRQRRLRAPARGWSRRHRGAIAAAVAAARDSDAVIAFVGLDPRLEGEERGTALRSRAATAWTWTCPPRSASWSRRCSRPASP